MVGLLDLIIKTIIFKVIKILQKEGTIVLSYQANE